MSREVVFRVVARNEYDAAVAWYEKERSGLGLAFQVAVDEALSRIAAHPTIFRLVRGPVRRAVLKRFPYTIYFLAELDRVVVLAVYHGSRDPTEVRRRN